MMMTVNEETTVPLRYVPRQERQERLTRKPRPSFTAAAALLWVADQDLCEARAMEDPAKAAEPIVKAQQKLRQAAEFCGANLAKAYATEDGTWDEWPEYGPVPQPEQAA